MSSWVVFFQFFCCLFIAGTTASTEGSFEFGDLSEALANNATYWTSLRTIVRYHTKEHPEGVEFVLEKSKTKLKSVETKIITHGYKSGLNDVNLIVHEYLKSKIEKNVLTFDWKHQAAFSELTAAFSAVCLGKFIVANLIRALQTVYHIPLDKIHLIGYDMGAHLLGAAAGNVEGTVGRITGLNPHKKYFDSSTIIHFRGLSKTYAKFVDVLHTNGGGKGIFSPIGTADFYPNGGRVQPSCKSLPSPQECSSQLSINYFAESIGSPHNFWGRSCNSYEEFSDDKCARKPIVVSGEFGNTTAKDSYYFITKSASPYGKGKAGADPAK